MRRLPLRPSPSASQLRRHRGRAHAEILRRQGEGGTQEGLRHVGTAASDLMLKRPVPPPDFSGSQVCNLDGAKDVDEARSFGFHALLPKAPAFRRRADEQRPRYVVGGDQPVRLPGRCLDLRLAVLQPVLDGAGYRQIIANFRVGMRCNRREYGIPLCNCLPLRSEEELAPLAGLRVTKVEDVAGLKDARSAGQKPLAVALGDRRRYRHGCPPHFFRGGTEHAEVTGTIIQRRPVGASRCNRACNQEG